MPVDHGAGATARKRGEPTVDGRSRIARDGAESLHDPVRGEDRQPLLAGRTDDDHHPRALLGAVLFVEREGGLVAMVTVRDHELCVGQRVRHSPVDPPQPVAHAVELDVEVGIAGRAFEPPS